MKKFLCFIVLAAIMSVFTGCNDDAMSYTDDSAVTSRSNTSLTVPWTGSFNVGTGWNIALEFSGDQLTATTGIKVEFTTTPGLGWWKIKMTENDASWTPLALPGTTGGMADISEGQTSYIFCLAGASLVAAQADGLNIGGYGITITKVTFVPFACPPPTNVIWEGVHDLDDGSLDIPGHLFPTTSTCVKIEFTTNSNASWAILRLMLNDASWTPLPLPGAPGGIVSISAGQTSYTFTLAGATLALVRANGLNISGSGITITKITTHDCAGGTVLWEGSNNIGNTWGVVQQVPGHLFPSTPTDVKVDFTTNPGAGYWCIKMMYDYTTWAPLNIGTGTGNDAGVVNLSEGANSYTFTLAGPNLANVRASELLIGGHGLTLKKISLVP